MGTWTLYFTPSNEDDKLLCHLFSDMKSKVLFDACSKNIQDDVESNINSESIPLLGRRPMRKGDGINFFILVLGILLFGGVTIGTYLIHEQSWYTFS